MNEFFQMLKKDHVEVKGILGQLKETKEFRQGPLFPAFLVAG